MDVITLKAPGADVLVAVSPQHGGEVASIRFNQVELVHRALDFSKEADGDWYGHGQLLWPAVGRHKDKQYSWDGQLRNIPIHGFAKDRPFVLVHRSTSDSEDTVALRLTSADAKCEDVFPFPFELTMTYTLSAEGKLYVYHTLRNPGSSPLPFAIGNHISLRFPYIPVEGKEAGQVWEAGALKGTITHQLGLTSGSLLDGTATPRPEFSSPAGCPLTSPGVTDGVFALDTRDKEAASKAGCELTLEQPGKMAVTLTNEWKDIPGPSNAPSTPCDWAEVAAHRYFVLWGLPPDITTGRHGFLCPEPWVSGPDSLNTKMGLPVLAPGEQATWVWTLKAKQLA